MVNPYAAFDCLAVGVRLQRVLGDVAAGELHLFSYLACLLSLYRRRAVADWEYQFAATSAGGPFSAQVATAIEELRSVGLLRDEFPHLAVTEEGGVEYRCLSRLESNSTRDVFIEGACASILSLPVGAVRSAICQDPVFRTARDYGSSRLLLEGSALSSLYEQFSALSRAVGVGVKDLMVPAVVWITYLARLPEEPQRSAEAVT